MGWTELEGERELGILEQAERVMQGLPPRPSNDILTQAERVMRGLPPRPTKDILAQAAEATWRPVDSFFPSPDWDDPGHLLPGVAVLFRVEGSRRSPEPLRAPDPKGGQWLPAGGPEEDITKPIASEVVSQDISGSSRYGDWQISQQLIPRSIEVDGGERQYGYSCSTEVLFKPSPIAKKGCKEITFIQAFRITDTAGRPVDYHEFHVEWAARADVPTGWLVDKPPGDATPYYLESLDGLMHERVGNPWVPPERYQGVAPDELPSTWDRNAARLSDQPDWSCQHTRWEFVTVAVCKEGELKNRVLGALSWGFTVGKENRYHVYRMTLHQPRAYRAYTRGYAMAVYGWNAQALGHCDVKNVREGEDQKLILHERFPTYVTRKGDQYVGAIPSREDITLEYEKEAQLMDEVRNILRAQRKGQP